MAQMIFSAIPINGHPPTLWVGASGWLGNTHLQFLVKNLLVVLSDGTYVYTVETYSKEDECVGLTVGTAGPENNYSLTVVIDPGTYGDFREKVKQHVPEQHHGIVLALLAEHVMVQQHPSRFLRITQDGYRYGEI